MKPFLLVTLLVLVAQAFPSCQGQGEQEIVGWVEEKFTARPSGSVEYVIVINTVWYEVPFNFWSRVEVGDLVKYDGTQWTIVRKKGS